MPTETVLLDEQATAQGLLVLRRSGVDFEIISDGMFLMDTRNGESERRLVSMALEAARPAASVLLAGLGVGFSVEEALDFPGIEHATVVEIHDIVIEWNRTFFGDRMARRLADPRLLVVCDDVTHWIGRDEKQFDAICLDVDNGPDWLSSQSNAMLYGSVGITALTRRLHGGGVLAIWSAERSPQLESRLRAQFDDVSSVEVPVPRGEPNVIYLARRAR